MKTVHKYPLSLAEDNHIVAHENAWFFDAQIQYEKICVWAVVDTDEPPVTKHIGVFGTGNPLPEDKNLRHIGTVQQPPFVWHIFEILPIPFFGGAI